MKTFKGTQGEWKAVKNSAYWEVNNNCSYNDGDVSLSINVMMNEIGKKIKGLSFTEECEANAKLIAAAPELLKALELILSNSNDHSIIRIATKAINKAL